MADDPTMDTGKRKLVKALGVGGAVGVGLKTGLIPAAWVKPVIDAVIPSAHAQVSVTPSPSPLAAPRPVPATSTGLLAVVAGLLGYVGLNRLRRTAESKKPD